jgi:hypothetical protein
MRRTRAVRKTYLALLVIALCLGCGRRHYNYSSIWQEVYGELPSYQDELEEMELEEE